MPFNDVAYAVSDEGCSNGRKDRYLFIFKIGIFWKNEGIFHPFSSHKHENTNFPSVDVPAVRIKGTRLLIPRSYIPISGSSYDEYLLS
jgi:hypothetical protein